MESQRGCSLFRAAAADVVGAAEVHVQEQFGYLCEGYPGKYYNTDSSPVVLPSAGNIKHKLHKKFKTELNTKTDR